jgi:ADP-ribosylglycohydrolase
MDEQLERERNVAALAEHILRTQTRAVADDAPTALLPSELTREQSKVLGTVLVAVVGDVLGANTEFHSMREIASTFGFVRNFLHSSRRPRGHYTDDGESTIALLQAIVDDAAAFSDDFERIAVKAYTDAFTALPRRGYGPTASAILQRLAAGTTTPDKSGTLFFPTGSYANGCLMRIGPLAVTAALQAMDASEIDRAVLLAMRCTHANREALQVCRAHVELTQRLFALPAAPTSMAAMRDLVLDVAAAVSDEHFRGRLELWKTALPAALAVAETTSATEHATLLAADHAFLSTFVSPCEFGELFAIRASEAFLVACYCVTLAAKVGPEEALCRAVNWGGDADTIACIAGSLLGVAFGVDWIPQRWLADLEDRAKIVALSLQLAEIASRKR